VQFPIIIGLHRSRFQGLAILGAALLGSGAALAVPRSAYIVASELLVTWLWATFAWRLSLPTLSAIRLERNGQLWIAVPGETDFHQAELLPGATVHPWLTVVRLKSESLGKRTLLLAADSLNAEDFRRLRVFLRWQAGFNDSGGGA